MSQNRPLSQRQQQILDFVVDQIRAHGYGPTVREIVVHVGDKSPTSVHRHLKTLEARGYINRQANKSRSIQLAKELRGLPLAGTLAAGSPIEAIQGVEHVDLSNAFDPAKHFLLRVRDDSMIDDRVCKGDLIVLRQQSRCQDGDMVVALIDGEHAVVKRFFHDAGRARLHPANQDLEPIYVEEDRIQIQGVVVSVIRPVEASPSE